MRKTIFSLLLCICVLLSAALPAGAKEEEQQPQTTRITIINRKSLLRLAEQCRLDSYSRDLEVSLEADIDLTGVDFEGFPVFSGSFEGNGHTIRGVNITASGSSQGFFRYLTDTAVVQNLNLEGLIQPEGSRSEVGGLAGSNAGRITNCTVTGTVSGSSNVGGLVGVNEISGILENCCVNGTVSGSHFVGGLAGENSGVIRNSENEANVNDTARQNSVELSDITLESLTGSESINTVTDIGGIAGTSGGVIRECVNRGNIGYPHMGYNIGGIAGTQSGMILNCENYGEIQGRKEVGGIVGQMEPTALIEYEEDALQILKRQLNSMGSTLNSTMSNLQGITDSIVGQVGALQGHVTNARDAVDTLIPDREDPQLPDLDTIQAAKNNISSSISGMSQTLEGMSATAYGAMGAMSTNLYTLQGQINAMRSTLGNVSETLGGSITDVSDLDSEEDLGGKVSGCVNCGPVLADRNAGGIAGAMSLENDLDHEDDWDISGNNSLNFESELRAVVLNCTNRAAVTVKKQNAGGIVGWQPMGLVKDSQSSGTLDAQSADYVGGIAGQSKGYIRSCSAKCEIFGKAYVGGIAGSGMTVTDCRSVVKLNQTVEKTGAILGFAEESNTQEEVPLSGNFYLTVSRDFGGIDGISYEGLAQPLDREMFLLLEDLPEMFQTVAVRFRYANGYERSFSVPLGGAFSSEWIPPLPQKNGQVGSWKDLDTTDLTEIVFDVTFESQYAAQTTVLQSEVSRNGQPVLLLQGSFPENARLTLTRSEAAVPTESGETLTEVWSFSAADTLSITTGRFRLPEEFESGEAKLLILGGDDTWREAEHTVDGSCLVFPMEPGDQSIALVRSPSVPWLWIAAAGAVLVIAYFCLRRYKANARKK